MRPARSDRGLLSSSGGAASAPRERRLSPWLSRAVLAAALLVLGLIARKFVLAPEAAAAASHIVLQTPLAVTNMRASFGAFPLGSAAFLLYCLISDRRLAGLVFVLTIMGTALAVRLVGVLSDGTALESLTPLLAETLLAIAAIAGERRGAAMPVPSHSSRQQGLL